MFGVVSPVGLADFVQAHSLGESKKNTGSDDVMPLGMSLSCLEELIAELIVPGQEVSQRKT